MHHRPIFQLDDRFQTPLSAPSDPEPSNENTTVCHEPQFFGRHGLCWHSCILTSLCPTGRIKGCDHSGACFDTNDCRMNRHQYHRGSDSLEGESLFSDLTWLFLYGFPSHRLLSS